MAMFMLTGVGVYSQCAPHLVTGMRYAQSGLSPSGDRNEVCSHSPAHLVTGMRCVQSWPSPSGDRNGVCTVRVRPI